MYFWRRVGAFVIDLSVISMFIEIIFQVLAPIVALTYSNIVVDFFKIVLYFVICIIISVGYNLICYKFFKYPLGKLLLNIKVLDENGNRIDTKTYFIREKTKYVYIYATLGLYIPFQFIMNIIKKEQSFHDKQANTHIFM